MSADETRHLYQVRESVDPLAAALAAQHRTSDHVTEIRYALSRLEPISSAGDLDALSRHREFHRAVYQASGNPVLIDILERLWDKADRYRLIGLRHGADNARDHARVAAEHRSISDAVAACDPAAAREAMADHIRHSLGRRAIVALGGELPD